MKRFASNAPGAACPAKGTGRLVRLFKGGVNCLLVSMCLLASASPAVAESTDPWQPKQGPLMTRWANLVKPEAVHPEYPRPQLTRTRWQNLNGLWQYAIRPQEQDRPEQFDGQILVPFAVESALSGVMQPVGPDKRLWYRRTFTVPDPWQEQRIILHFGAVDWETRVWINGQLIGTHRGGYDPFHFDITDYLGSGDQELVVSVWDPSDAGYQPRGKQVRDPEGIWYTSVTGIWQTVWLEPVAVSHIEALKITPDVDQQRVRVQAQVQTASGRGEMHLVVLDEHRRVYEATGRIQPRSQPGPVELEFVLPIEDAKLWSPEQPFLYDLKATLNWDGQVVDEVDSYFGMRKIEVRPDEHGRNRLFLNNQPLFQYGPLDQGWWPDGLYTAPTDEALRYDLEVTRRFGMNMVRKHVKVEPARWYYWCDKLGLLVWQDMPNGDRHIGPDDPDIVRSAQSASNFRQEYKAMVQALYNHPSIVVWVPFNEGWGQFQTDEILAWAKQCDPTRLIDGPSGWADRGSGDMHDMHRYPGPAMPEPEPDRAVVLGEFGGLGWPVKGHLWSNRDNWGYRTYQSQEELQENYERLVRQLPVLISRGLAAAVYTQTTDVEGEVNGLMTYDRAVIKLDIDRVKPLHAELYQSQPPLVEKVLVPTSRQQPQRWRYTTDRPAEDWASADFDDSHWPEGQGGFGESSTPGSVVRTPWKSEAIWLRRTVELPAGDLRAPHLRIHHDEDAEVYLNGQKIASLSGYTTDYTDIPLDGTIRRAWRPGRNVLAVHCRQTAGGQYIDVGLIDLVEAPASNKAR